jgi:hypothetical protein
MYLLQAMMVRMSSKLLRQALQFTDERAKLEGELVSGIDVVKCAAWEVSPGARAHHGLCMLWKAVSRGALHWEASVFLPTAILPSHVAGLGKAGSWPTPPMHY